MQVRFCQMTKRLALFTQINRIKHSPVFKLDGDSRSREIRGAIKVAENHYVLNNFGQYMRHSSEPSCVVRRHYVIAARDMDPGDELTYDYFNTYGDS